MSATTPRRENMSASNSPSKGTARRVLGDIAARALNTPSKQGNAPRPSDVATAKSPLKQVSTLSPNVSLDKENMIYPAPYLQSKKRSFYEVDDAETPGSAKAMFGTREPKTGWRNALTATELERYTTSQPVDLPMPGSPTERNTPTPDPDELTTQPHSQESGSFSNYINYDQCASQKSEHPPPSPSPSPPPLVEAKKEKSKAELLRTRLALGIYKVKTNQTEKRSSDIISSFEATKTATTSSTKPMPAEAVPSITLSTTTTNPQFVSIKANLDPGRPIGKLTPAPVLVPTAYSSRMARDYNMESSPPQQSVSPQQLMSSTTQSTQARLATPVPKRFRSVEDRRSEDDTRNAPLEERIERVRGGDVQKDETPSSVGKGSAARGLMNLMHGQR